MDNQNIVDEWNAHHPVGTNVVHTDDFGNETHTKTTSCAELLGGHTPVVWLEGKTGCHDIDRVEAI